MIIATQEWALKKEISAWNIGNDFCTLTPVSPAQGSATMLCRVTSARHMPCRLMGREPPHHQLHHSCPGQSEVILQGEMTDSWLLDKIDSGRPAWPWSQRQKDSRIYVHPQTFKSGIESLNLKEPIGDINASRGASGDCGEGSGLPLLAANHVLSKREGGRCHIVRPPNIPRKSSTLYLMRSSLLDSVVNKPNWGSMRLRLQSLASLSGLRIQHCCEL